MDKGNPAALIQINEFVILGGAAVGSFIAANGTGNLGKTIKTVQGLLKPDPYTKETFMDVLKMMYLLFNVARKEGLLGLEQHIENPETSDIIGKFPSFVHNHHAQAFFCDTMKVILTGAVGPHDLSEMMEIDLETAHAEMKQPQEAITVVGDAMPGFGIVAAVLGIIVTMGKIGGEPGEIGKSVAAALVGTFLGILLAYGVFAPIARSIDLRLKSEAQYLACIRFALFARRNIEPSLRPGFSEMETAVKEQKAA
jgi:chemotaxis protein MotA